MKWPDFCSSLTVRRLVPLDVDNTGYSLFVVGDGQVVVTALRSSPPQAR